MTHTIVYSSRAVLPPNYDLEMQPVWLSDLVERASVKNKKRNISGVLAYKNGKILQLIEGSSTDIQILFGKIQLDSRHTNVQEILSLPKSQRLFSEWGMLLEPDIKSSYLFREFLHAHLDDLVEMKESASDELIYFIDHIFKDVVGPQTENPNRLN